MLKDIRRHRVAVLSKVNPLRGINAAVAIDDNWEDHYYDTVKDGWFLGDQDAVKYLAQQAPQAGSLPVKAMPIA